MEQVMEIVESLNHRYVRILAKEEKGMGGYPERMVLKNRIAGLLPMDRRFLDGVSYYYYDITVMKNLEELYQGRPIAIEDLESLLDCLEHTVTEMEKYLLPQSGLYLSPSMIMGERGKGKYFFLFLPPGEEKPRGQLEELWEFVLDHVDSGDEQALEYFYEFYCELQRKDSMTSPLAAVRIWNEKKMKKQMATRESMVAEETRYASAGGSLEKPGEYRKGKIYQVPFRG